MAAQLALALIPAFYGSGTDAVGAGYFTLRDATIVSVEDLETERA